MDGHDAKLDVSEKYQFIRQNVEINFKQKKIYQQIFESDIEGELTFASSQKPNRGTPGTSDFNTLDEPIKETFVSRNSRLDELAKIYNVVSLVHYSYGMFVL
jgi:hypothetical protein